ncbi:MAG: hypothetical protein JNJ47_07015, partial [Alphaproteobacteria bacterium]|nr:hypothetical protein [Alphaproteobacteria bacterium]
QTFKFTDAGLFEIKGGISSLPNITKLIINNQELLSDEGLSTLLEILKKLPSLEELALAGMNLHLQEKEISNTLSQLTCLTKLDLSNNKLVGNCLDTIAISLPKLEELNISNNKITGKKLLSFPRYHPRECLKVLNIAENQIDDVGFYCISLLPNLTELDISHKNTALVDLGLPHNKVVWGVEELAKNITLTKLNLWGNKNIDIEGAYALAQNPRIELAGTNLNPIQNELEEVFPWQILILTRTPTLTELHLSECKIGDKEAQVLALSTSLTELNLSHNNIGDGGAEALAKSSILTKLNLSHNDVKDKGAQDLAWSQNLKWLNLSNNQITDKGAQALAKNTVLTELDLSCNNIKDWGARALANNTTLTLLDLSRNDIKDWGAKELAKSSRLKWLNLYGNKDISIEGVHALAKGFRGELEFDILYPGSYQNLSNESLDPWKILILTRTPTLTGLNFSGCKIRDEEAQVLALSTSLTELNLSHNNIGDGGAEALAK